MASVVLDQVRKVYDNGHTAVQNVSLDVKDGEFVILVGPSGCGKSTLLRMVAGLESVTDGSISIAGRVVNEVAPRDRSIAMVFQNYALYPHMSVRQNLAFGLRQRRAAQEVIDERIAYAARILELEKVLERKPRELSGGQRQRVAVGRAIVRDAEVFLFDEPLSNLDANLRAQMRTELAKLHARLGKTMIYVTHDQVEAMTMGDRIAALAGGRVVQFAPPLTLYNEPANEFVAQFVGSPPMNMLHGQLQVGADREGGVFTDERSGLSLRLPVEFLERFTAPLPARVGLGLRPEDLYPQLDSPTVPRLSVCFHAQVIVVEPMGAETVCHCEVGAETADARTLVSRQRLQELPARGVSVRLLGDLDKAHLFDGESGVALS